MTSDEQELLINLFQSCTLATLSSVSARSTPESALVAFVEEVGHSLFFQTFTGSRKYKNLQTGSAISLVTGWELDPYVTLQYEGNASELTDADDIDYAMQLFDAKDSPSTIDYLRQPESRIFRVKPTWLRYSDYRDPDNIIIWETTFSG